MSQTKNFIDQIKNTKKQLIAIINRTVEEQSLQLNSQLIQSLATHLAVALIRLKTNSYIPLSQGQIAYYKNNENYSLATTLCQKIASQFDVQFPESEQALISMYLSKVKVLDVEFNSGLDLLDNDILVILENTVNSIAIKHDQDFRNDDKLLIALGLHLSPAIDRLLNDDQIDNPLLDKIKERYPHAYDMAQILNDVVESVYHKRFSDGEIAYFALHFALAMKHNRKNKKAH